MWSFEILSQTMLLDIRHDPSPTWQPSCSQKKKKKVLDFVKLEYYKVLNFRNIEYYIVFLIPQIPSQQCHASERWQLTSSSLNSSTI